MKVGQQRRGVHRGAERPYLLVQDVAEQAQAGAQVDDEWVVPSMSMTRHDVFPP